MIQTLRCSDLKGRGRALLFVDNDLGTFLWHRLALARIARDAGFDVHVAAPASAQTADLTNNGFVFHPIPLTRRGINPFREVLTVVALHSLYRKLKPALIHHLRLKPVLYGTLAARLAGRPVVANSLTGLGYIFAASDRRATILRRIAQLGLRVALRHPNATVIFENPDDRRTFVDADLVSERRTTVVAGSGVDVDFFRETPFPSGTPLVIFASRMLWDKGVAEFVEAARLIGARGVRARFALVGDTDDGNPSAVSREQLRKWHDEGVVEWWGWRRDIHTVLAQSHAVCLPSSYGEGIPRVLIEAASCGRPLVATNTPGCREIVRDGLNGFLVPVKDARSLANALHKLLIDPDLRVRMGANGRKLVLSGFSLEHVLASNLAVYEDLLSDASLTRTGAQS
jgi:glycosyltransferase involved in cell wall biosynthesis